MVTVRQIDEYLVSKQIVRWTESWVPSYSGTQMNSQLCRQIDRWMDRQLENLMVQTSWK